MEATNYEDALPDMTFDVGNTSVISSTNKGKNSSEQGTRICWTRRRILKNLMTLSCTFLLMFTSYSGVATLQSTMNSDQGVGVASQAIIYVFFCISALTLPKFVITKLGCKVALAVSIVTYCPYVASNFYPRWVTLIPSAVLLGLGASVLWSSNSTYINELSSLYCAVGNSKIESITARFFGFFGTVFMSSHIWGNLASFYVLQREVLDLSSDNNITKSCGATFCSDEQDLSLNPNLSAPSVQQRSLLIGIFLTLMVLSVLLSVFFLDSLPRDQRRERNLTMGTKELLASTLNLTRNINQLLLMGLAFYAGLAESFHVSDYTMAYVACPWGIYHVGIVAICNGMACSISSAISGFLVKYLGRPPVIAAGAIINVAVYVLLFTWTPDSHNPVMIFVVSGLWGSFSGIFWSQVRALYGLLFKSDEEAGFANYYLWNSLGFCLSFSYSPYLCMETKIYVASSLLAVSMLLYGTLEIKLILNKRNCPVNAE